MAAVSLRPCVCMYSVRLGDIHSHYLQVARLIPALSSIEFRKSFPELIPDLFAVRISMMEDRLSRHGTLFE